MVTEVCRQQRTRRRFLGDGTVIQEEQEVVFTERRTTWPPAPANSEVQVVQVKEEKRTAAQEKAPVVEGAAQDKEGPVHVDGTGASIPVVIAV